MMESKIMALEDSNKELIKARKKINEQIRKNNEMIENLKKERYQDADISLEDLLRNKHDITDEEWYRKLEEKSIESDLGTLLESALRNHHGTVVTLYIFDDFNTKHVRQNKKFATLMMDVKDALAKMEKHPYINVTSHNLKENIHDEIHYFMIFDGTGWQFCEEGQGGHTTLFKEPDLSHLINKVTQWNIDNSERDKESISFH